MKKDIIYIGVIGFLVYWVFKEKKKQVFIVNECNKMLDSCYDSNTKTITLPNQNI